MVNQDKIRSIIMDTIIAIAVCAQVYFVMDEITDGNFSREFSVRVTKLKGRISEELKRERFVRKNVGRTIWEAMETLESSRNVDNSVDSPGEDGIPM